jgi:hypothetical protein
VADAGAGRHHPEVLKRTLRPFQELVALLILLVLFLDVLLERGIVAVEVDDHRMIDDEVDRDQRINLRGIAAEILHGVAHGREIDHGRHAGEILHQDASRAKCDLTVGRLGLDPLGNGLDVLFGDRPPVLVAQQVLQQDFHRERQSRYPLQAALLGRRQAVISIGLVTDSECAGAFKAVERCHDISPIRPSKAPVRRYDVAGGTWDPCDPT